MNHIYNLDGTGINEATIYDRGIIEDKISNAITEIMDILGDNYPAAEIEMYVVEEVIDRFLDIRITKKTEKIKLLRKEKNNE